ncbi:hypothetical protein pEaSNUABM8_00073 [Erwinia phage pEa_SNUABM_8]|nr:hypothetical protein pEaSNUABM8_00073 [Erwinia phage pEa_SNUABM_8]QVW54825.1 hypothetical protein pEaSNUABM4_00072 [Erwinia phage pEa_SNUABM_4]
MSQDANRFSVSMPGGLSSIRMTLGGENLHLVPEDVTGLLEFLNDRNRIGTYALRLRTPFIGSGMFAGVKTEHLVVDIEARTVTITLITSSLQQHTYGRKDLTAYLRELNKIIQKDKE